MFRMIRSLSRPVGLLLLAFLVSPTVAAECRLWGQPSAGMACCHDQADDAALQSDCCALKQPSSGPEGVPVTVPPLRSSDGKVFFSAAPLVLAHLVATAAPIVDTRTDDPSPPQDLYLRNSVIRR